MRFTGGFWAYTLTSVQIWETSMESQPLLNANTVPLFSGQTTTGLAAWRRACLAWWQSIQAQRACRRTATLLKDLDQHMLDDIGAPAWALRESEIQRQIEESRRKRWLSI